MTKNTITDLNNHLFEQLERIADEDLTTDQLNQEINRADAITKIADKIIDNAELALKAQVAYGDRMNSNMKLPMMLENKDA